MIEIFENLQESEVQSLREALPLIAILIGQADNHLDEKELELAKKITHIRTFNSPEYLIPFYEQVEKEFDNNLEMFSKELPTDAATRNEIISGTLSKLNPILAKLDPKAGAILYNGFIRFGKEIAKASGGFLGFMSVNSAESKWVNLPMITPIVGPEEEE